MPIPSDLLFYDRKLEPKSRSTTTLPPLHGPGPSRLPRSAIQSAFVERSPRETFQSQLKLALAVLATVIITAFYVWLACNQQILRVFTKKLYENNIKF